MLEKRPSLQHVVFRKLDIKKLEDEIPLFFLVQKSIQNESKTFM
jgi:hypothetical protein